MYKFIYEVIQIFGKLFRRKSTIPYGSISFVMENSDTLVNSIFLT